MQHLQRVPTVLSFLSTGARAAQARRYLLRSSLLLCCMLRYWQPEPFWPHSFPLSFSSLGTITPRAVGIDDLCPTPLFFLFEGPPQF